MDDRVKDPIKSNEINVLGSFSIMILVSWYFEPEILADYYWDILFDHTFVVNNSGQIFYNTFS